MYKREFFKYKMYQGGNVTVESGHTYTEKEFQELYPSAAKGLAVLVTYPHTINGEVLDLVFNVDNIVRMKAEYGIVQDNDELAIQEYVERHDAEIQAMERERQQYIQVYETQMTKLQADVDYNTMLAETADMGVN